MGRICIAGSDITGGPKYFADVLGEIPAVGVPGAVFAYSKGARCDGLGGVPSEKPERRMGGTGEVATGNLQIAAVDVSLMKRYIAVGCYLFRSSAPHGIIAAFDDCSTVPAREANRSIFRIVLHRPDARGGLDQRLIAIRIKNGNESRVLVLLDGGVLIEFIRRPQWESK